MQPSSDPPRIDNALGSTEFELLLACCTACFSGPANQPAISIDNVDWTRLLHLARRHRVQGLCFTALNRLKADVPAAVWQDLKADHHALIEANLRTLRLARRLQDGFQAAAIPLTFLKGHCLSQLAYGDPLIKVNADLDIFVLPEHLGSASKLLSDAGCRLSTPSNLDRLVSWHRDSKESVWNSSDGISVDLHTRLADNSRILRAVHAGLRTEEVSLGPDISLRTLKKPTLLVYLAVHGAASAWFRLKWLSDFAALVVNSTADELQMAAEASGQYGAERAWHLALLLSRTMFGADLSANFQVCLKEISASQLLKRLSLDQLLAEVEPTQRRLGTLSIHAAQLLLKPGMWFPIQDLTRQIRTVAAVRSAERQMASRPRAHPLLPH